MRILSYNKYTRRESELDNFLVENNSRVFKEYLLK